MTKMIKSKVYEIMTIWLGILISTEKHIKIQFLARLNRAVDGMSGFLIQHDINM